MSWYIELKIWSQVKFQIYREQYLLYQEQIIEMYHTYLKTALEKLEELKETLSQGTTAVLKSIIPASKLHQIYEVSQI
jgi:hypothetical protein